MLYEIWDAETANMVGGFETEGEAWEMLGLAFAECGPEHVAGLILGVEEDNGESRLIASGSTLADLVGQRRATLAGSAAGRGHG